MQDIKRRFNVGAHTISVFIYSNSNKVEHVALHVPTLLFILSFNRLGVVFISLYELLYEISVYYQ